MVALGTPVPRSPTKPTSASRATTYRPERLLVMLFPEALSGASLLRCVLLSHKLLVSVATARQHQHRDMQGQHAVPHTACL